MGLKKLIAILPVFILTCLFVKSRYRSHTIQESIGLFGIVANIFPLYLFILIDILKRKKQNFMLVVAQSAFYVYIFMVLTLTIFFIHVRIILAPGFVENIRFRISHDVGVNLVPFTIFKEYKNIFDRQITGNFIMLLPLGIFLPILYKNLSSFIKVLFISLFISITIELIQLINNSRRTDIDDVILNTSGALVGFLIYKLVQWLISKKGAASINNN
jgi:glycopeptide antibiotics resistance protein